MSVENDQQFALDLPAETNDESAKKPKTSYTREFLLSLSNLDICKKLPKLPSGFDQSLLRDSEDPVSERRRTSGDFSSHGFRRNDYSSSPPTRGELSTYSRGAHGRWEGRSGRLSDKDSDSQSDHDPESGRRYGVPPRRPWQAPEHDGLLGKGSFPRPPPGYGVGASAPKSQSNDSYQLTKSSEPYQPPRPYKAVPHSRHTTKDTFNDETFGSSDSTSEDRAEEERKRRASFELLRKEHHKQFQERQKLNPEERKTSFDFSELMGDSPDEKGLPDRTNQVSESPMLRASNNTSAPSQNTAPRPLVPPGFASAVLDRKQGAKPHTGISQHEPSLLNAKGTHIVNGTSGSNGEKPLANQTGSNEMLMEESADVDVSSLHTTQRAANLPTILGLTTDPIRQDLSFEKLSSIPAVTEAPGCSEKSEQATTKVDHKKNLGNSDGPSILDKLFNTALNLNTGESSNFIEPNDNKREETWSPQTVKSSKFAHLFLEEDNKVHEEDVSSSKQQAGGLLSLLQGSQTAQNIDVKAVDERSAGVPLQGRESIILDQLSNNDSPSKSAVLTCEDLEQSILSQVSDGYSAPPPSLPDPTLSSARTKQHKAYIDNQASQHLLSLLQRRETQDIQLDSTTDFIPPSAISPKSGNSLNSGKALTLENLFGNSFMKELQSVGEPVSGKAGVSEAHGLQLPVREEGIVAPGGFFHGVGHPEEDNNLMQQFMHFRASPNQDPEIPLNIAEKLAALNSGPRNDRPSIGGGGGGQSGHYPHHPLQYANGPILPPHSQLQPSQHGNVMSQIDHQFPAHMVRPPFHHAAGGVPEFDRLPHPLLQQQMHMRGNLPHPSLLQGFPGGHPPHPHQPHVNNQMLGLIPASQGFPFPHLQPNYSGHNIPPPAPEVNRFDNPASLQRLLGIDPKQIQAGGMHRQGSMGHHDLDLGLGYR